MEIDLGEFKVELVRGGIAGLTLADGTALVGEGPFAGGASIARLQGEHRVIEEAEGAAWDPAQGVTRTYTALEGLEGGQITVDASRSGEGDLVLRQHAQSKEGGVWGVGWTVATIPLTCNLIIPAHSGMKLTAEAPGARHIFDYPMAWEAQILLVESPAGGGFYVWAEDADRQYKRLVVDRHRDGWQITFYSMPLAPFEAQREAASPPWHIGLWKGDWREPLRRYRTWAAEAFPLPPGESRGPAWANEIRGCVIMGLQPELLPLLAERFIPEQTVLYIPGWRKDGYDRNYPDYSAVPELDPFLDAAHDLGFRVMLHVNYFGCDPKHPAYERFRQYQCRKPFEKNEPDWWIWNDADPPIKFAYINPAAKEWRDFFVETMKELCARHDVDALHLDQTLVVYNEGAGMVDGMTMLEGNVALHAALREALPTVALSGEGLNEATFGDEDFAQRHVWGLAHHLGEYSMPHLRTAHPVSSYLFRDRVTLYGYLGMVPPTQGQLYSAWQEAYRHFGVIPTLARPNAAMLENPQWFTRQLFDEVAYFQEKRIDPAMERDWPPSVLFPYLTDRQVPVEYTANRELISRRFIVSHTLRDRSWWLGEGSVPGWQVFDFENMRALDRNRWYPYVQEPPDRTLPHIEKLPPELTLDVAAIHEHMAFFRIAESSTARMSLAQLMADAVCGTRPLEGEGHEVLGSLYSPDGGNFFSEGDVIHAHPPYIGTKGGESYARFTLTLPWNARSFIAKVALDPQAVGEGKSDGVRFQVFVQRKDYSDLRGIYIKDDQPRELGVGLRELAGKEITLELRVDAGPENDPTFDWARWIDPVIENDLGKEGPVTIEHTTAWPLAVAGKNVVRTSPGSDSLTINAPLPCAIYLLDALPRPVAAPYGLTESPFTVTFSDGSGVALESPANANAEVRTVSVDGADQPGFFTHPPDHGRTLLDIPITLPVGKPVFRAMVRLGENSPSKGVILSVEAGGIEQGRIVLEPGGWQPFDVDLSPWSGKPTVLSLITSADGSYAGDWTLWGNPRVELAPKENADDKKP